METLQAPLSQQKRIESIDLLRGLAMIVMALDHVRDYFHILAFTTNPMDPETTNLALYFSRWITHFCAPFFVFLSGTSIFLQSQRKSKRALSQFLLIRGLWLILVEVSIITLAWSFNPFYNFFFFQVIWAIGASMLLMGLLIWLPFRMLLATGFIIVLGHNAFDAMEAAEGFQSNFWWDMLHIGNFAVYPITSSHMLGFIYPVLPWTGVMILGYGAGVFYSPKYTPAQRKKLLTYLGLGLLLLFITLRLINVYGDPKPWTYQKNTLATVFSFLDVNKYPPSLIFTCMTLSPLLILLAAWENLRNGFARVCIIFGRTAFFYYILHLYLIHFLATISFYLRGHSMQQLAEQNIRLPFWFIYPGDGYSLGVTYLWWILIVALLFPLCHWYNNYKSKHRHYWWLSYL